MAPVNSEQTNDDDTKQDTSFSQSEVAEGVNADAELEEDDEEEEAAPGGPPKWLRYAKHKPKPYFTRKFLGGNESARALLLGFYSGHFQRSGHSARTL